MIYDEVAMHTAKSQMHSFATHTHTVNPVVQTQEKQYRRETLVYTEYE